MPQRREAALHRAVGRAEAPPAEPSRHPGDREPRLQPLLHDLVACLRAPTQVWSGPDGQVRGGAHGAYHGDVRVLSYAVLTVGGREPEGVAVAARAADDVLFVGVARRLGDPIPDPTVRVDRSRRVRPGLVEEYVSVVSTAHRAVHADLVLAVECDLALIERVKSGDRPAPVPPVAEHDRLGWRGEGVTATLSAPGAQVDPGSGTATWAVDLAPRDRIEVRWTLRAEDARAVVVAPEGPPEWAAPLVQADDRRLAPLIRRSLDDLAALRMVTRDAPSDVFLAAGAPWFFTLFGRDSLWAARMLLPLGTELAASTLRALASRQGAATDAHTAEEPGKILHELRRGEFHVSGDQAGVDVVLPPVYYGTVDATPLWVTLLHDAWRWGMPVEQVQSLLPHLVAALTWMAEHGDADGDGFLEYVDHSGHGLTNQGWKDSGDSVQWRDGSLATAPIALCEVQGYAYEAASCGAALLDAFGLPGGDRWREWAGALADRFRTRFWVDDRDGSFPAVALDADKRPVDTLTSNAGHLLGTGLLSSEENARLAERLGQDDMVTGFGLRTMSARAAGYGPLSYHGGTVWPHDTAIVLSGLARAGCHERAATLVEGLLEAGAAFGHRLPELFGGDDRADVPQPVPYPAACRPQAWAAASGVSLLATLLGTRAYAPAGSLLLRPLTPSPVGALHVRGLQFAGRPLAVAVDRDGRVTHVDAPPGVRVTMPHP